MRRLLLKIALPAAFAFAAAFVAAAEPRGSGPIDEPVPKPQEGVYDVSQVDKAPVLKSKLVPHFPFEMRLAGVTKAEVTVVCTIRASGKVTNTYAIKYPDRAFDAAAVVAVIGARYTPALIKDKPVDCQITQIVKFEVPKD